MKRWFVVYTQVRGEERAVRHLENQGIRCFLPRYRKTRRHARKTDTVLEPLFPRYLFTEFDPDASIWRSINGTRGVVGLLTGGARPLPVPKGMVERLWAEAAQDGTTPLTALGMFWKGRKVRVKSGPFANQRAEVAQVPPDGKDRVQILLNLLGVETSMQVPSYALEIA